MSTRILLFVIFYVKAHYFYPYKFTLNTTVHNGFVLKNEQVIYGSALAEPFHKLSKVIHKSLRLKAIKLWPIINSLVKWRNNRPDSRCGPSPLGYRYDRFYVNNKLSIKTCDKCLQVIQVYELAESNLARDLNYWFCEITLNVRVSQRAERVGQEQVFQQGYILKKYGPSFTIIIALKLLEH